MHRKVSLPHVLRADYLKALLKTSKLLSQGLWREKFSTRLPKGEELKNLLMRVKEESERAGLKLNVKKTKIMPSGPITLWQTEREKVELGTNFLFLGPKITADGDCGSEIRGQLLLGRKAMTNLDCAEKQRHCSATKGPHSQGCGLPSGHVRL